MENKIIIYADGGCRNNQSKDNIGAWGYVATYKGKTIEKSKACRNTTNNKQELSACINALKDRKQHNIPIEIYVDSAYVLNGITNWIHGWKAKGWRTSTKKPVENKELWIELDNLRNQFDDVKFFKVKGHSNIDGNERADEILNVAMNELENEVIK